MADIADRLAELAPDVDHPGARRYFEGARSDRRRRRRVASAAAFVVVAAVAAATTVSIIATGDGDATVASTERGPVAVELPDLTGGVVEVELPRPLAEGFDVQEQTASLHLGSTTWRLDVERAGSTGPPDPSCEPPVPATVSDVIGAWKVTFSGDGMTASSCRALLDEMRTFTPRSGALVYDGSGDLGPIDGPDVLARTDAARISLFHRSPSCSHERSRRTPSGLIVERVDDPARGTTLTVLCDAAAAIELWIDAPEWPSEDHVDAIEIQRAAGG